MASSMRLLRAPCVLLTPSSMLGRTAPGSLRAWTAIRGAASLPSSSSSSSSSSASSLSSAVNPPSTTLPPPLDLPTRVPGSGTFAHLLATGKAYLAFYKTGLRYLYANWQLVRALRARTTDPVASAHIAAATDSRSDLLLRHRWSHDVRRLPLFAVLLAVCGEMTPFVVLVFPHVVPGPCRIPKQVDRLQRLAEARRHAAFVDLAGRRASTVSASPSPPSSSSPSLPTHYTLAHIARSLGLVNALWDRLGWIPARHARAAVALRLHFLASDDHLLRQPQAQAALIDVEVALACTDRGLDVRGVSPDRLRDLLATWLVLTDVAAPSTTTDVFAQPATQRRIALLTTRPEQWPSGLLPERPSAL